jgi:quercetin dioxygenase-like cupin family protein
MSSPAINRFSRWMDVPCEAVSETILRQVVSGDALTLSKLQMKKGATVSTHAHPNEQFTYILEGKVQFKYGEKLENHVIVGAGELLHIPANVPHNAVCLEDAIDLDIFTPIRADWATTEGNRYLLGDAVPTKEKST